MQWRHVVGIGILISSSLPAARAADAPPKKNDKPEIRVAEIFIIGNTVTPAKVILSQVPVKPGDVIKPHHLRAIEQNLEHLKLFRSKPIVDVFYPDEEEPWRNVLIKVEERRKQGFGLDCLDAIEQWSKDSFCGEVLVKVEQTWGTKWMSALTLLLFESFLDCVGYTLLVAHRLLDDSWDWSASRLLP